MRNISYQQPQTPRNVSNNETRLCDEVEQQQHHERRKAHVQQKEKPADKRSLRRNRREERAECTEEEHRIELRKPNEQAAANADGKTKNSIRLPEYSEKDGEDGDDRELRLAKLQNIPRSVHEYLVDCENGCREHDDKQQSPDRLSRSVETKYLLEHEEQQHDASQHRQPGNHPQRKCDGRADDIAIVELFENGVEECEERKLEAGVFKFS